MCARRHPRAHAQNNAATPARPQAESRMTAARDARAPHRCDRRIECALSYKRGRCRRVKRARPWPASALGLHGVAPVAGPEAARADPRSAAHLSDRLAARVSCAGSDTGGFRRAPKFRQVRAVFDVDFCLRGVKPQSPRLGGFAHGTGELGMELSPKGKPFGEGSPRKRTVQEASRQSKDRAAFYNSSVPGREKRTQNGARRTRTLRKQHPRDYSARTTRPASQFPGERERKLQLQRRAPLKRARACRRA